MEMAKVTSKGQITIPVSIRRRLNINEGDKLLFIDRPDGVMMVNPDMLQAGQRAVSPEPEVRISGLDDAGPADGLSESGSAALPVKDTNKPKTQVGGLDVAAILDEIRIIGSNI